MPPEPAKPLRVVITDIDISLDRLTVLALKLGVALGLAAGVAAVTGAAVWLAALAIIKP